MNEADVKSIFLRDEPERAEFALVFGHASPEVSGRWARHAGPQSATTSWPPDYLW